MALIIIRRLKGGPVFVVPHGVRAPQGLAVDSVSSVSSGTTSGSLIVGSSSGGTSTVCPYCEPPIVDEAVHVDVTHTLQPVRQLHPQHARRNFRHVTRRGLLLLPGLTRLRLRIRH